MTIQGTVNPYTDLMSKKYPNTKLALRTEYTKTGIPKYVAELEHTGLDKHRVIRDPNKAILRNSVEVQFRQWHNQWEKQQHLLHNEDRAVQDTLAARDEIRAIEDFLTSRFDRVTRLTTKSKALSFGKPKPIAAKTKSNPRKPRQRKLPNEPVFRPSLKPPSNPISNSSSANPKPDISDRKYAVVYRFSDMFSRSARRDEQEHAKAKYRYDLEVWSTREDERVKRVKEIWRIERETWQTKEDERRTREKDRWLSDCESVAAGNKTLLEEWERKCDEVQALNEKRRVAFCKKLDTWRAMKSLHEESTARLFESYKTGSSDAVQTIISTALGQVQYPSWFKHESSVFFDPETRVAGVDFRLPEPTDLPSLKEVTYVKSRDDFSEKYLAVRESEALYDSLIYQSALLALHVCFRSTLKSVLDSVVFNGFVKTRDASTGKRIRPFILSVHASRQEFSDIDLAQVNPKECVRKLRGVGSSKLHSLAPIAPILTFDKEDSRFIEGRNISGRIDDGTNIAAMPWDDFEHLMRDLFEKVFADRGMEVKVTQQSRDRGVDAIAFDPDPITGGKYVIQAKCYTNVVPASAVRELEGTVSGERASKGILVTTSSFGPEAIKWASDKPLTLIDGSNLLHLLEQIGHKAYIDLDEAKRIREEEQEIGKKQ